MPFFVRYKSWKRRWFILNDNCFYYFEFTTDKEPRGIIPLENIKVMSCLYSSPSDFLSTGHNFTIFLEVKLPCDWSVLSAIISQTGGKFQFPAPIGALVLYLSLLKIIHATFGRRTSPKRPPILFPRILPWSVTTAA